eukprot:scaffold90906_cov67-Phaeocystis_antarctica.AAC.3
MGRDRRPQTNARTKLWPLSASRAGRPVASWHQVPLEALRAAPPAYRPASEPARSSEPAERTRTRSCTPRHPGRPCMHSRSSSRRQPRGCTRP